jgi:hypothetical protein
MMAALAVVACASAAAAMHEQQAFECSIADLPEDTKHRLRWARLEARERAAEEARARREAQEREDRMTRTIIAAVLFGIAVS